MIDEFWSIPLLILTVSLVTLLPQVNLLHTQSHIRSERRQNGRGVTLGRSNDIVLFVWNRPREYKEGRFKFI